MKKKEWKEMDLKEIYYNAKNRRYSIDVVNKDLGGFFPCDYYYQFVIAENNESNVIYATNILCITSMSDHGHFQVISENECIENKIPLDNLT